MDLGILAWILGTPVAVLTAGFAVEVLLGLKTPPPTRQGRCSHQASCVIIIPAHDEESSIARCVYGLAPQLNEKTTALVVADNCSDRTAVLARLSGAAVIERNERDLRGKAYALAFARDFLTSASPDVVVILDADCAFSSGAVALLVQRAVQEQRPVQGTNLLRPIGDVSPLIQFSNFAFYLKNRIRQLGLARLGAPALLNGTGMAFPWATFKNVPLATDSLVEDLELGVELARKGQSPVFEPGALVLSNPAAAQAMVTQRSRWEGGFLASARQHGLPLLVDSLFQRSWPLAWMGLHLLIPPLTLLLILNLSALTLAALASGSSSGTAILVTLLAVQAAAALAVGGAWAGGGRSYLSARAALRLPLYIAWKLPLYWSLLMKRPKGWIRTERS